MKKFNNFLLLSVSLLAPTLLFAHAKLTEASPANGAVANESPEALTLTFNEDVQLLKLTLTDTDNKTVATEFKPSSASQNSFIVALPELAKGAYTVNWTAMGDDGHKIEENYSFSIDASAPPTAGIVGEQSHTEHSH